MSVSARGRSGAQGVVERECAVSGGPAGDLFSDVGLVWVEMREGVVEEGRVRAVGVLGVVVGQGRCALRLRRRRTSRNRGVGCVKGAR